MNSKRIKNCFAAGALALSLAMTSPVMAQANGSWTLNHDNADIRAVIGQVAEITGKNFVIDQRVKGKITVISNASMDKEDVYKVFLSILRVHGYAAVETGNVIKIIPESGAKQDSVPVLDRGFNPGDEVVTRVLQVNNVAAAQLVPILRPLVPQQGHLAAYPPTNVIIISDRAANIERLTNIIRRIDQASDEQVDVIRLENASAKEVVRVVADLYKATNKGSRSKNATPKLVADERTNSILLTGDSSDKLRLKALIAHLDSPLEESGNTRVIYLNYAKAEDLVKVLTGVKDSLASKGGAKKKAASTSKEVSILSDESLNALVITAPPALMRSLQDVIRKLDIRRAQVLVEAIIIELDETQADKLGVQWLFDGTPGGSGPVGSISFGGQNSILNLAAGIATGGTSGGSTAVNALDGGAGIILGDFNRSGIDFGVLINALKGSGAGNILSTPSLTMLDNEDAEIVVGQNVPFVTGSTTSSTNTNPFTTISREDIGVTLKVTSQINEGDAVRMEIEQEVSSLAPSSTGASDLITNKRSIKTTVLVDDGKTIVLGGLIRDDVRESVSKVPLLGDIPLLGSLFRYRNVTSSKSNLMVFIKPTIIRDVETQNALSASKYGYIRDQLLNQKFDDKPASFDAEALLPKWPGDPVNKAEPAEETKQPEAVNE